MVLGFPCNQFGGQEPDDEQTIKQFAKEKYGVTFPMFSKVDVNGPNAHPIYVFLKSNEKVGTEDLSWNFNKFLVNRKGEVVSRYTNKITPNALESEILNLLDE